MRAAAVLALAAAGCAVPVARPTAIGTSVPAAAAAAGEPVSGSSCRWWVLGVPLGLPGVDEALADALRRAGAPALTAAVVLSEHPAYGVVGRHCYVVRGTPWGGSPESARPERGIGERTAPALLGSGRCPWTPSRCSGRITIGCGSSSGATGAAAGSPAW